MKIKTVLIEDNKEDLQHLINELKEISFIDVIGSFSNPVEAITFIKENTTNLIISDIEMPGINGISAIKLLSELPLVIFISSHPKYALESFQVSPLDYLVKPFSKENLLKAMHRALESSRTKSICPDNFTFIYIDKNYNKVFYDDILYIKAEQNYSKIFMKEKKSHLTLTNLSQFLKELPEQFIRVHKSYAINIATITGYNLHEVQFDKNTIVPISEAYKFETLSLLSNFTASKKK